MLKFINTDGGREEEGYTFETEDCSVRAFALALKTSYTHAHMWLSLKAGRKAKQPIALSTLLMLDEVMIGGKELVVEPLTSPNELHCVTHCVINSDEVSVKEYILSHSKGTYMLIIPQHIFAVVDGVIMDNFSKVTPETLDLGYTLEPAWYAIHVKE